MWHHDKKSKWNGKGNTPSCVATATNSRASLPINEMALRNLCHT